MTDPWKNADPGWLAHAEAWEKKTGISRYDLGESEMPCVGLGGCGRIVDLSDIANPIAHGFFGGGHQPSPIEPGAITGKAVTHD